MDARYDNFRIVSDERVVESLCRVFSREGGLRDISGEDKEEREALWPGIYRLCRDIQET